MKRIQILTPVNPKYNHRAESVNSRPLDPGWCQSKNHNNIVDFTHTYTHADIGTITHINSRTHGLKHPQNLTGVRTHGHPKHTHTLIHTRRRKDQRHRQTDTRSVRTLHCRLDIVSSWSRDVAVRFY